MSFLSILKISATLVEVILFIKAKIGINKKIKINTNSTLNLHIICNCVKFQALTMSNEARKTSTVGEIVNLMSIDCQRVQEVTANLYLVWSAPLQIIIAMYMLWGILGPSILAGVGVMILLLPLNGVVANMQNKLQVIYCCSYLYGSLSLAIKP